MGNFTKTKSKISDSSTVLCLKQSMNTKTKPYVGGLGVYPPILKVEITLSKIDNNRRKPKETYNV